MLRRLKFFGFGALISIIFLSLGPENRMKNTFYSYLDYFNPEKRVLGQMLVADSTNYFDFDTIEIRRFYNQSWVNHELTDKYSSPQIFVIENKINNINKRLVLHFYDSEQRKVDGFLRRYSRIDVVKFEDVDELSVRSYKSYFSLLGIFLFIMIPVVILVRKLSRKIRIEDE